MLDGYNTDGVTMLTGLDAVRKRPGMYIGDTHDGSGLLRMLMEVVSNSVGQFLAGKATVIVVRLYRNGDVEVSDNGEGMPVYEKNGVSVLQTIMTTRHRGIWGCSCSDHEECSGIHL